MFQRALPMYFCHVIAACSSTWGSLVLFLGPDRLLDVSPASLNHKSQHLPVHVALDGLDVLVMLYMGLSKYSQVCLGERRMGQRESIVLERHNIETITP